MTPSIPTSALESAFQNPIVYGLLLLLIVSYLLAEITGKLEGPINKFVVRRRAVALKTAAAIGEQPAEIASLRLQMEGLVKDVARLVGEVNDQRVRLDDYQRKEEIRDNLAATHRIWDIERVNELIDRGVEPPAPPPLHVHPSMMMETRE